jgi:hypothetical protein
MMSVLNVDQTSLKTYEPPPTRIVPGGDVSKERDADMDVTG